ncbi:MAG TPA: MFS transporter, partial [Usitatibacter sp.]|nr:MFS transporter [Usitatibacter sp.]
MTLGQGERRAVAWSFAYFFCLLASYYVLRPLRDEMGIAGGVGNLPWLFTATFVVMLVAVPVFGALVARLSRRVFIPIVYHFFAANIVLFWLALNSGLDRAMVARVFFVWISVFNLFAVSVFWSFMADVFTSEQGKRLFGFIAAGGSAGALLGPLVTVAIVGVIGPANLLVVAAVLLEGAVFCAQRLEFAERAAASGDQRVGGGWLAGLAMVVRSPYLAGIAAWVFCLSLAGTFLYLQQAAIVSHASTDPAVRTRIFATIDLSVG